jgi:hypothetical protein
MTIAMLEDELELGFDQSYGSANEDCWPALKSNGATYAIFRFGEGPITLDNVMKQATLSIKYAVPFGGYFAIHPWADPIAQVDRFLWSTRGFSVKSLGLDCELKGASLEQANDVYYAAYTRLKTQSIHPVFNYSGEYIIRDGFPGMIFWVEKDPYWNANYETKPFGKPKTWAEFHTNLTAMKAVFPVHISDFKIENIDIWQFAGNLEMPMLWNWPIDLNLGSKSVINYLFRDGIKPIHFTTPTPVVVPTDNLIHYRVNNTLPNGKGTTLQEEPNWTSKNLWTMMNSQDLYVDPAYVQFYWYKVVKVGDKTITGYVSKERVSKV